MWESFIFPDIALFQADRFAVGTDGRAVGLGGCGEMTYATIVVFEKQPRLTPELQRQFSGQPVQIRGCRSLGEITSIDSTHGPCVAVLDLDSAVGECLRFLSRRVGRPRVPPVVVVASHQSAALEWPVRELGAAAFVPEFNSCEDLSVLCRRQWKSVERTTDYQ